MKSNILEIQQFLAQEFPQSLQKCAVIDVQSKYAQVSYRVDEQELRPGGTVSGPTIMTIADFALYIAILAEMGIVALAVTSNMNIHFLRKPDGARNLVAEARLIKVGRVLVVGEVWVYSEGIDDPVAHVTGSYSLPIKA